MSTKHTWSSEGFRGPLAGGNKGKNLCNFKNLFSSDRLSQTLQNKSVFLISQTKPPPQKYLKQRSYLKSLTCVSKCQEIGCFLPTKIINLQAPVTPTQLSSLKSHISSQQDLFLFLKIMYDYVFFLFAHVSLALRL